MESTTEAKTSSRIECPFGYCYYQETADALRVHLQDKHQLRPHQFHLDKYGFIPLGYEKDLPESAPPRTRRFRLVTRAPLESEADRPSRYLCELCLSLPDPKVMFLELNPELIY